MIDFKTLRATNPRGARVILDATRAPKKFNEPPMLRKAVARGELPPAHDRIGRDPLVIEPLDGIGEYGGTLRRAFTGPNDISGVVRFASGPDGFLYWNADWTELRPNIARDFSVSEDGRVTTIRLRRGMRWSDGAPFTADDVMFWYEDLYLHPLVVPTRSQALQIDGEEVAIEKVDQATIRYVAPKPYQLLTELLGSNSDIGGPSFYGRNAMGGYAPKHYLSQFHPKYVSEDTLNANAREAGFANWSLYLKNRNDWTFNPDLPVVSPWRVVTPINEQDFRMTRNAFSIWVDTAGNQLPYIDRIHNVLCSGPDAVNFKAAVGRLDYQSRHLFISNLPFLLKNRARSNYHVDLNPSQAADLGIRVNLSYRKDAEIGALLGDVKFRRALSLGVDRREINESFMLGLGAPSASAPPPDNRFYPGDDWARRWARYDPTGAERMLDEVGLVDRDSQGFRLRRDGGGRLRLVCQTFVAHFEFPAVAEMVREQWRKIGIDMDVKIVEPALALQQSMAGEVQLGVQLVGTDDPFIYPDYLFPYRPFGIGGFSGVEYGKWFQSNGADGEKPPAEIIEIMEGWRKGREMPREGRIELGKELIKRHIDLVLSIGLVSGSYTYHGVQVRNADLANVPERIINSQTIWSPVNALPMTFYFRNARRRQSA